MSEQAVIKRKGRTHAERESDLAFVAQCAQNGEKKSAILEKLAAIRSYPITIKQVEKDYAEIESRWVTTFIRGQTLANLKSRELARLEALEEEAWKAWTKSKTAGQVEKFDVSQEGKTVGGKAVTAIKRDGDPKFLELMLKYSEHRCKILGLFAPIKIDAEVEDSLKTQDELDGFRKAYAETLLSQQRALPKLKNITPDEPKQITNTDEKNKHI